MSSVEGKKIEFLKETVRTDFVVRPIADGVGAWRDFRGEAVGGGGPFGLSNLGWEGWSAHSLRVDREGGVGYWHRCRSRRVDV